MKKCPHCAEEIQDAAVVCRFCNRDIVATLPPLPKAPVAPSRWAPVIGLLTLTVVIFLIVAVMMTPNVAPTSSRTNTPTTPAGPTLELIASSGTRGEYYNKVNGQVKNLSSEPMDNVMVVVTWLGKDGSFITSDKSLIDYRPLMPGQTSPFSTITSSNPLMTHFRLEFSTFRGQVITHRDSSK